MSERENQVRSFLADPAWALPVPPDPAGWAKQRARRRPWRPIVAALAAAGVAGGAAVIAPAALQPADSDRRLVVEQERDGLTIRVNLDTDAAVVGARVTGQLTVRNDRAEPVRLLEGCRAPLRLFADYSAVIPPGPANAGPVGLYRQLVLTGLPRTPNGPDGPLAIPVASSYTVVREQRPCARGEEDRSVELPSGRTAEVKVDWVPGSPGGAPINAELPMRAGVTYILPDGPDGPVEGDPAGKGSTTPNARVLDVDFSMPLSGGDPKRAPLPDVIDSALGDPRFRNVLQTVPAERWRYVWALPFDKPSRGDGQRAFTAGEADTDQILRPTDTWYVVLNYASDHSGREERVTALVDGDTATVRDVIKTADAEIDVRPAGPGDPELGTVLLPPHATAPENHPSRETPVDLLATFEADGLTLYLVGSNHAGKACTTRFWSDPALPAGGGSCGPASLGGAEPTEGGLALSSGWSAGAPERISFSVDGSGSNRTARVRILQSQREFEIDAFQAGPRWAKRAFFVMASQRAATTIVALDDENKEISRLRAAGG